MSNELGFVLVLLLLNLIKPGNGIMNSYYEWVWTRVADVMVCVFLLESALDSTW